MRNALWILLGITLFAAIAANCHMDHLTRLREMKPNARYAELLKRLDDAWKRHPDPQDPVGKAERQKILDEAARLAQ
jgi:hypothetical protein